ncbi:HD domain [Carpediemonas membranifera]|uniref:5'-deoxynucleotidase n=1 Tax=Carpediemonas membranifera TaxID=201153 RepID=A0A8J6AYA4_9EUKA|nr:HD domain [Carpediemonas membranifera]|eukprot:KAG9390214.1 HD domain [Carpediemonas membranifera]
MFEGAEGVFRFIQQLHDLKHVPRTGWVNSGVPNPESVADHSFSVAFLAMVLGTQHPGLDVTRCIKMALVHDLAESVVGDITPFDGVDELDKHQRELKAMESFQALVGDSLDLVGLFQEYEEHATPEARFVKDLDKLEMISQAADYERRHGVDLPSFFETTAGKIETSAAKDIDGMIRGRR